MHKLVEVNLNKTMLYVILVAVNREDVICDTRVKTCYV